MPNSEYVDIDGEALFTILQEAFDGGIYVSSALLGRTVAEGEAFEKACRLGLLAEQGGRWRTTLAGDKSLQALKTEIHRSKTAW